VKWRIIYREHTPSGKAPSEPMIHIIAVGPRAGLAVYETAAARIAQERTPMDSRQRRAEAAVQRSGTAAGKPGPAVDRPAETQSTRQEIRQGTVRRR
jgi:hypothetical protein